MIDLSVKINEITFKNPLLNASGIISEETLKLYKQDIPFGGLVLKTYTINERLGNSGERLLEIPCGMMNSIGLANPGIKKLNILPYKNYNIPLIISIGITEEKEIPTFLNVINKYKKIKFLELNLSCPNVKGKKPEENFIKIKSLLKQIREFFKSYIIFAKLSYSQINEKNITIISNLNYDGITILNTLPGIEINIQKKNFYFDNKIAGLSGEFLSYITMDRLYYIKKNFNIPVIACGGVKSYEEVVKYLMLGAEMVQIGSSLFSHPLLPKEILKELKLYMKKEKISNINEIKGALL